MNHLLEEEAEVAMAVGEGGMAAVEEGDVEEGDAAEAATQLVVEVDQEVEEGEHDLVDRDRVVQVVVDTDLVAEVCFNQLKKWELQVEKNVNVLSFCMKIRIICQTVKPWIRFVMDEI